MARRSKVKIESWTYDIKKELREESAKLADEAAKETLSDAKMRIHNISGELAASGRTSTFENRRGVGAAVTFGDDKAYYAVWVEVGTPGAAYKSGKRKGPRTPVVAHPYLRPAAKKASRKFIKEIKELVK